MIENKENEIFEEIKLENFIKPKIFVVRPIDTLAFARKLMLRNNISKLIVVDEEERILGIISLRDIAQVLTKLGTEFNETLDQVLVKEIAFKDVAKLDSQKSVKEACRIMKEKNIGSVVILKEDKLAGIFTPTDACKVFMEKPIENLKVDQVMHKKFETVNKIASIWKIIGKFKNGVDVVVVEDNKRAIGIITLSRIAYLEETEFLTSRVKYIRGSAEYTKTRIGKTAGDIMYSIDLAINANDRLSKAVNYLLSYDLPALPVINEYGEIVGLVTKRNVVDVIAGWVPS